MQQKPNCSTCGAPIIWHVAQPSESNPNPKPNPLDAQPTDKGNIFIFANGEYVILSKDALDEARAQRLPLYISHFVTCPDAKKFRRK